MSRVKGGFTVELKRPKRHLLNTPVVPKASWVTQGALLPAEPRTDPGSRAGASSDHDARAMAERLFAPRTTERARILPVLSPLAAISRTPDAPREPVELRLAEEEDVTGATETCAERDDPSVTNDPAVKVTEDAVTPAVTSEPGQRQKTRRVLAVDLPAGKRWMRLLPSVLQERAVPHWKRMRSVRVTSRVGRRHDRTSDENR